MAQQICDICHRRPATTRVTVLQSGQRQNLDVCDYDYAQLTRHQRYISPLESLFQGNSLFDEFFGDRFNGENGESSLSRRRALSDRESVSIDNYLSEQTKEFLQRAAEKAVEFGKREVDTEHLLYALTDSEVVQAILKQFKLSPEEIRSYIDQNATRGDLDEDEEKQVEVGVSPRVKSVLERAFTASRELGHRYVGTEHLLIGLAEVPDSFAGTLLQKYGLTPAALRQQTVKVVGKGAEEGRVETPSNTPQLDKYSRDLTALAQQG
ncbi:ATP-dependent Clp protease ATP-binding subunit, partial [Pseudanabaenaceae cyanobacterium LEGE 13415]|nr:ATP-dependent Clp protease ATP-binding subunit [Pseudanabaenaceae cyanobacterium LEGE 13415]